MKRLLALVLTAALLTHMSVSVYATNNESPTVVFNDEFNFQLVETVDENNRIIRTYQKNEQPQAQSTYSLRSVGNDTDNYERTKALLSDLGMGDAFISELSDEQLEEYAASESMTGIVSYTKSDLEGNVIYVSEEEASVYGGPSTGGNQDIMDGGDGGSNVYTDEVVDSYMRLYYMVIYQGDALYKHIVTAEWLTMPVCRSYDSLGGCSTGLTVELGSRYGWYSYNKTTTTILGTEVEKVQTDFTTSDYYHPSNGVWYGSGVLFQLPTVINTENTHREISDFKVYFEYESRVRQPQEETYIETNATYDHSIFTLTFSPSLELSSEDAGISIGISGGMQTERHTAYFDKSIHYIPE